MKKLSLLTICFIFLFSIISFAGTWVEIPSISNWIYLTDNLTPLINSWLEYDDDKDGKMEYFYFGANGVMLRDQKTPDGKDVDIYGHYIYNGKIVKKGEDLNINNQYIETTPAPSGEANIINASQASSSAEKARELKNCIAKKSGIEFVETKKIEGKSWANLIRMSGNDSYLKSNCGNNNRLTFEAGVAEKSDNATYLLTVYVNGEILGEYDDEYFNDGEKIECDFDPNSEIMIVYSCVAEEGMYLSSDNKYLYLRNAKYSIKN